MRSLKEKIQYLIEKGFLKEARETLNEYEKLANEDPSMYSIKGIIYMLEGNIDEAEKFLKKGLEIDDENFDILYNLGYLYQSIGKNDWAIDYYKRALKNTKIQTDIEEIYEILNDLGLKREEYGHIKDDLESIMLKELDQALANLKKVMYKNGFNDKEGQSLK